MSSFDTAKVLSTGNAKAVLRKPPSTLLPWTWNSSLTPSRHSQKPIHSRPGQFSGTQEYTPGTILATRNSTLSYSEVLIAISSNSFFKYSMTFITFTLPGSTPKIVEDTASTKIRRSSCAGSKCMVSPSGSLSLFWFSHRKFALHWCCCTLFPLSGEAKPGYSVLISATHNHKKCAFTTILFSVAEFSCSDSWSFFLSRITSSFLITNSSFSRSFSIVGTDWCLFTFPSGDSDVWLSKYNNYACNSFSCCFRRFDLVTYFFA